MSLIDKAYFTLEELEERWQLPQRDLVYLAENGLLRLSVRLFGVEIECVSTPEQNCIGFPEQNCISDGRKKAPDQGAFSSSIRVGRDYPPVYPSCPGVSGACFD